MNAPIARPAFSADLALMSLSPGGLVQCSIDWIKSAISPLDPSSRALACAMDALRSAPDMFISDEHNRGVFWRVFFRARHRGAIVEPLSSLLADLDKSKLASFGKDMMIMAASDKDAESFSFLLNLGIVRKSKLVLFSGYKNGGRAIAQTVKKPTAAEAAELVKTVASHAPDDLLWLLGHCPAAVFPSERLSMINASSPDKSIASAAMAAFPLAFTENLGRHSVYDAYRTTAKDVARRSIFSLAACGGPQAARSLCDLLSNQLAADDSWVSFCRNGERVIGRLTIASSLGERSACHQISVCPQGSTITIQAACVLGGDYEAAMWLRSEYASLGVPWLSAQELSLAYDPAKVSALATSQAVLSSIFSPAIALSERVDMEFSLRADSAPAPRRRASSL